VDIKANLVYAFNDLILLHLHYMLLLLLLLHLNQIQAWQLLR